MRNILPENFTEAIGWTIFHSIWQIALIAALLGILLIVLGKFSAQLRYFIASATYIFILGVGVFTFVNNFEKQKEIITAKSIQTSVIEEKANRWIIPEIMKEEQVDTPFLKTQLEVLKFFFSRNFAIIAFVWVLGIMLLSLKFLGNLVYLQRMKNYRVIPLNKKWQDKMLNLQEKLGIKKTIGLLESSLAKVPMVIGFIKPVILMPFSALSGLSTKEIECIIAHELAHIKRNDYIINVLQKVVEILFFYHPAVWWISSVIKMERENCCDDIAVSLTGDSVNFVKALANMEEKRIRAEHLAVAFSTTKNQLLKRVQRILNQRKMKSNFSEGFIASCVIFIGFLTIAFSSGFTPGKSMVTIQDDGLFEEIKIEVTDTIKNDEQYSTLKNLEEGKAIEKDKKREYIVEKEREYVKQREIEDKKKEEEMKKAKMELDKAQQQLAEAEKELQKAHEKLSKKEKRELEEANAELQRAQDELERARHEMEEAEAERKYKVHVRHETEDLDDIIEEAMEDVEIAIEEIDEDEIAEVIAEAMEEVSEAIEDIDFDEIYGEIADAVHDIAVEIDIDEIMDEVREGIREARYEVRTQVRHNTNNNRNDDIVSEHISKLTEGVDAWNEWRVNSPGLIPQLAGANLYDFDLTGINFEEANLNGAELKEINLNNANLFDAQLRRANLKEAVLNGAILREASFYQAEMKEAVLKNADARYANFRYANLKEADFSDADLREADLSGADLSQATLKNTKLKGAKANSGTSFPSGFDAEAEGIIIMK